ncbi:ABC transporter ATP-binding protein [Streptomyces sp. TRM 70351]|uniref:ABC transporter ATP-binding protein n=1 Tax=Streptomyces sp. TRM 70351 TaxID=3116552 RepID=UPI002E7B4C66|nr:ABC transporter ATP-binding protein [Streptomyces sp. TRM 70351]MEE1930841.1 ABC transporter ATP-binding protein [Streptomyces sp. TRM 70351]
MGSTITLHHLSKIYPSGHRAVHDVSLHMDAGEFLVLLGPSGCGKSTLLRMIAGLETITSGELSLDQQPANDLPASERDVAMVFQNFALYPTMTAAENIAFPLTARGGDGHATAQAVNTVADRLGIRSLLSRVPAQMSGGERQRVAMGRAVIRRPSVFLMDEPLSSLDARLRVRLRTEILSVVRRTGATTVHVTHDQAEAMALGDRIAGLHDGTLQQIGTPEELYALPASAFVASFVGTPRINLVHGALYAPIDGAMTISLGPQRLVLPQEMAQAHQLPHHPSPPPQPAPPLPDHYSVGELVLRARHRARSWPGDRVTLLVDMRALMLFSAQGQRVFPHPTHRQAAPTMTTYVDGQPVAVPATIAAVRAIRLHRRPPAQGGMSTSHGNGAAVTAAADRYRSPGKG